MVILYLSKENFNWTLVTLFQQASKDEIQHRPRGKETVKNFTWPGTRMAIMYLSKESFTL